MITTLIGYMEDDGTDRNMGHCAEVTHSPSFDPKMLMRPSFGASLYAPAYKVRLSIGPNAHIDASIGDWDRVYKKVDYTPYTRELVNILENGWAIGENDLYTLSDNQLVTHKMLSKYLTGVARKDSRLCDCMGIDKMSKLLPSCNKWALFFMLNYREDVMSMIGGDGSSLVEFIAMEDLL